MCGSFKFVAEVTRNLVLDSGTTQEQYEKWVEMEVAEFLVLLQRRRWVGVFEPNFYDGVY